MIPRPGLCLLALVLAAAGPLGGTRPSVILISVDTLRADHLGAYGSRAGLTPHLDRFASRAVVFEEAYSSAPLTGPSLSVLLSSHYQHETKISDNGFPAPSAVPTLPEVLKEAGYATAAVLANPVLYGHYGFPAGFDVYACDFSKEQVAREERKAFPATRTTTRALLVARDLRQQPLFLWVHYMDPHGPYLPPGSRPRPDPKGRAVLPVNGTTGVGGIPAYQYVFGERDPESYRRRYREEVAYVDREIGRLLDGLGQQGLLSHTIVIITADHGESLGEHDYYFAHGEYLYKEALHVPLMVRGPGLSPGRRADVVGLVDLVPSLAEVLRLDVGKPMRGVAVFQNPAPLERAILAATFPATATTERYAAIRRGETLVFSRPDRWELFLSGDESKNVIETARPQARALASELWKLLGRDDLAHLKLPSPIRAIDEETAKVFRSLGYLR